MATPRRRSDGTTVWCKGALLPGVADIIACNPAGRFLAVECKTGTGKLSPAQRRFQRNVEAANGVMVVVHDTVDELLCRRDELLAGPGEAEGVLRG